MDGACNEFLAGARFSLDQYGGPGRGDSLDLMENRFQRGTVAYDLLEPALAKLVFSPTHSRRSYHDILLASLKLPG
jgi:hypothetical protein